MRMCSCVSREGGSLREETLHACDSLVFGRAEIMVGSGGVWVAAGVGDGARE